jgi:Tfp pilus assembly protein PilE
LHVRPHSAENDEHVKHLVIAVAVAGVVAAVSIQVRAQFRMRDAEKAAAATLNAIVEAQRAFRKAGGRGGYATDLQSLTEPCAGEGAAVLAGTAAIAGYDYRVVVRAAERAAMAGTDCHGRPVASNFYASVRPAHAWAGRQAMASTARGRIYVFFDGLPPVERDMDAGGLAVPLDTLDTFKIP